MTNYLEIFNQIVSETIKPRILTFGYKKSGLHFYQKKDDLIKFFSIEKGSWNSKDEVKFWFNVSIFDNIAHKYLGEGEVLPKLPHDTLFTIIKASTDELRGVRDQAYILNDAANLDSIKSLIVSDIEKFALPFLDKFQDKEDLFAEYNKTGLEDWRGRGLSLFSALHQIDYGDSIEGLNAVTTCYNKWIDNQFWRNKLSSLINDLKKNGA